MIYEPMAASRWHTDLLEMYDWLQDEDISLEEILLPSILTRIQKKGDQDADNSNQSKADSAVNKDGLPPF